MELRVLKYFVAVAEELHFGRAAQRLHISQPPLSQQIKSLEQELGAELFMRSSRRVELTPAGRVLLDKARTLLALADAAAEEVGRVAAGLEGTLRLGFVTPAMDGPLSGVLAKYKQTKPGVRLELKEASSLDQLNDLRSGHLDVAIVRSKHGQDMSGLASKPFMREAYVIAMPKGHDLAGKGSLGLKALDGRAFIFFSRDQGPKLHDRIMAAFERAGARPLISQEVLSKRTMLTLVAAGLGLALVPASSARAAGHDLVFRQVDDPLPLVEADAVWSPANPSPLVHDFIARLPHLG
jgi:DNA-binding transcriptional LysR family regulator